MKRPGRLRRLATALGLAVLAACGPPAGGNPAHFESDIAAFEAADRAAPPEPGAIVFVGSSSIRFWDDLAGDMAPLPVLNRGFGGSHLEHVVYAAPRIVTPYAPRAVVVYAGDNDLASGSDKTPERVERDYRQLVELLRVSDPALPVYFLTIKPSPRRWDRWPAMAEANARIETWSAQDPNLHVIDVASPLLGPDGEPRGDLFIFDGLHLSDEGYAAWRAAVRPVLLEAFGPAD